MRICSLSLHKLIYLSLGWMMLLVPPNFGLIFRHRFEMVAWLHFSTFFSNTHWVTTPSWVLATCFNSTVETELSINHHITAHKTDTTHYYHCIPYAELYCLLSITAMTSCRPLHCCFRYWITSLTESLGRGYSIFIARLGILMPIAPLISCSLLQNLLY